MPTRLGGLTNGPTNGLTNVVQNTTNLLLPAPNNVVKINVEPNGNTYTQTQYYSIDNNNYQTPNAYQTNPTPNRQITINKSNQNQNQNNSNIQANQQYTQQNPSSSNQTTGSPLKQLFLPF